MTITSAGENPERGSGGKNGIKKKKKKKSSSSSAGNNSVNGTTPSAFGSEEKTKNISARHSFLSPARVIRRGLRP
jgi:hypothetical protein